MPLALGLVMKYLMMQKLIIRIVLAGLLIGLFSTYLRAQSPIGDIDLLKKQNKDEMASIYKPTIKFMQTRSNNIFVKYNPVRLSFGALMYFYQGFVSPQLPSQCFYHPSCSQFSKALIYDYGLVKGLFTTSDRLMRCNRLSALDIHPMQFDESTMRVKESIDLYKISP
jgi:uncharacterized protein